VRVTLPATDPWLERWLPLVAKHASAQPVLELGCGNGRIALPIARCGIPVDGIDASSAMLQSFRDKLDREPRTLREQVRLTAANFCALPPPDRRYPLVTLPFNALHHCTSLADVEALLHGVRSRLLPDGVFALDCYLPDPTLYARDPNGRYELREFVDPTSGKVLESWEESWWDETARIHHVIYVYERPEGVEARLHLQLHMYDIDELRETFTRCGFAIAEEASDFSGLQMRDDAVKWVLHLRVPGT